MYYFLKNLNTLNKLVIFVIISIISLILFVMNDVFSTISVICLSLTSISLLVLSITLFALFNYVAKSAFFVNEMYRGMALTDVMQDTGNKFTYSERFRVQAMFFNPFDYGYICILLLLFNWYGYIKSFISKKRFYMIIGCCLYGIITCGCRTIMLCCFRASLIVSAVTPSCSIWNKIKLAEGG